jgi:hypothetical protein
VAGLLEIYISELMNIAAPYWRSLRAGFVEQFASLPDLSYWSAADLRSDMVLLLDHWDPGRLREFLSVQARFWHAPGTDTALVRMIASTLLGHLDMTPDEVEEWVRWPFQGDIRELTRNPAMHVWRALHPDGSAARHVAACLGITAPAQELTFGLQSRDDVDELPLPPADDPAWPGWLTGDDLPVEVTARLFRAGWPVDRIRAELGHGPGAAFGRSLPPHLCLPPAEFLRWRSALAPGGTEAFTYDGVTRLRRLILLWRHTGLPPEAAPWCAAARMSPQEAIAAHRAGRLRADGWETLTALSNLS